MFITTVSLDTYVHRGLSTNKIIVEIRKFTEYRIILHKEWDFLNRFEDGNPLSVHMNDKTDLFKKWIETPIDFLPKTVENKSRLVTSSTTKYSSSVSTVAVPTLMYVSFVNCSWNRWPREYCIFMSNSNRVSGKTEIKRYEVNLKLYCPIHN